jgi:hypothetical protein
LDEKPDKISRSIIKKNKMIDLNAFVNALKATWVVKTYGPRK